MDQSEVEANQIPLLSRQARENACEQVMVTLTSDWLKKWRVFF